MRRFALVCLLGLVWIMPLHAVAPTGLNVAPSEVERVASSKARPRSLGSPAEQAQLREALLKGERAPAFQNLLKRLHAAKLAPHQSTSLEGRGPVSALQTVAIKNEAEKLVMRAQQGAFAGWATRDAAMIRDAKARLLQLAAFDPQGMTGVKTEDLSARNIVWTLALGLDWLDGSWTAEERQLLLVVIGVRMDALVEHVVVGPPAYKSLPRNSHPSEIIGGLVDVSLLMAGESPAASDWLKRTLPLYLELLSPWGREDGGFANGTAYASWDVGEYSLRHWDSLLRISGVDVRAKPWVRNVGRYFTYMLPPGTPSNQFGDAAERRMSEVWARYAKAYALRVPEPLYRWYARQWFEQDDSTLELLAAPLPQLGDEDFPVDTPDSAYFPSVGWVAMHSSLRERGRTSLYFKSSEYGSVSHSHADQNSFTLVAGGKSLLIDSGYYDYFSSPHHVQWYRQTRAHNAITVDGGQGQGTGSQWVGDAQASGRITQYAEEGARAASSGDATAAYRDLLTRAVRGVLYQRPATFVIVDDLAASRTRSWEWNLHALQSMQETGPGRVRVENEGERVCVEVYEDARDGLTSLRFEQHTGFHAAPVKGGAPIGPDQWHGRFTVPMASKQTRLVAVLRVGCHDREVRLSPQGSVLVVQIDDKSSLFVNGEWKLK